MIYDTFPVEGNCKGCGNSTYWHINGDYPVCLDCMESMIYDIAKMTSAGVQIKLRGRQSEN